MNRCARCRAAIAEGHVVSRNGCTYHTACANQLTQEKRDMGLTIPDDLAESSLTMFEVREIVAARKLRKAAERKRDHFKAKMEEIDAYINANIERETQMVIKAEPQEETDEG